MSSVSEVWKPVLGFEGQYEVSSEGRVRSLPFVVSNKRWKKPVHRPGGPVSLCKNRYMHACLRLEGNRQSKRLVHRLVAEAFFGPCPAGMQVNHKNGDKCDNRVENLEYCTPSENAMHALRTGLSKGKGETHYACKYSDDSVRAAVQLVRDGLSVTDASRQSGVSRDTIREALAGEHRKDIGLRDDSLRAELGRGERNHHAVLTESQVLEIRRTGGTYADLSRRYGVSRATVRDVVLGRTWKHVQEAVA